MYGDRDKAGRFMEMGVEMKLISTTVALFNL